MTTASWSRESSTAFDDFFWEGLLLQLEERRVVPVIGEDLLVVEYEGRRMQLYRWAAEQLAARLRLSIERLPDNFTLNDVVCAHLAARGDLADVYIGLAAIMRESAFVPPEPLQQLAAITDLDLYVTTTFDSLLATALQTARPGVRTEVLAYAPGKVTDLGPERERHGQVTVYHLFGRVAPSASYAVSDEDLLEFLCRLQAPNHAPERLFAQLENSHLLILGCGFADWLGRFFLRTAKRHKLSDRREVREILADRRTRTDPSLALFLEHFSRSTKVYDAGNADDFVAELWRRWQARAPAGRARDTVPSLPAEEMPDDAIFVSYTRKDLESVKRLKAGLEAVGLTVWFDISDIEPGDDFARVIQSNITRCRLFISVISSNTEARREAFFFREWRWAIEREEKMAADQHFILPIVIDDTHEPGVRVPRRLTELHWTRLPDGHVTPAFGEMVRKLCAS